jgi:uncharacterized protein YbjT (DUF2867 family)
VRHAKLEETLRTNFFDYADLASRFADRDACFFCLGVSVAGMREAAYRRLMLDLPVATAHAMVAANPGMTFCFVSGAGTDAAGTGRAMWARVKGEAEKAIRALPFRASYMFRPGFIRPMKGVRSRTPLYNAMYAITNPLYPLLRRLAPGAVTTSEILGRAMIRVAREGYPSPILETRDLNRLGAPA